MNKSKSLRVMAAASVLFLLTVAPSKVVHAAQCLCDGFPPILLDWDPPGGNDDSINIDIDLDPANWFWVDDTGHTAVIGDVVSHHLSGLSDVFGAWEIIYDTANPAPTCTLLAAFYGTDLFPAYNKLYLNWLVTVDTGAGPDTFRTISPVEFVSETLGVWPTADMNYTAVTDAYLEDVTNRGNTLILPLEGTTVTISHVEPVIPTLTEWGMIIFCVLLFGWMAWVIVRRRRRVSIGV